MMDESTLTMERTLTQSFFLKKSKKDWKDYLDVGILLFLLLCGLSLGFFIANNTDLTAKEALYAVGAQGGSFSPISFPKTLIWIYRAWLLPLEWFPFVSQGLWLRLFSLLGHALVAISLYVVTKNLFPVSKRYTPIIASSLYLLNWSSEHNAIFDGAIVWSSLMALWGVYHLFRATESNSLKHWFLALLFVFLFSLFHYMGILFFLLSWLSILFYGRQSWKQSSFWLYTALGLSSVALLLFFYVFFGHFNVFDYLRGVFSNLAFSPWVSFQKFILYGVLGSGILGVLGLLLSFSDFLKHKAEPNVYFIFVSSAVLWVVAIPFLNDQGTTAFFNLGGVILLPFLVRLLSYRFSMWVTLLLIAYGVLSTFLFYWTYMVRGIVLPSELDPNRDLHLWKEAVVRAKQVQKKYHIQNFATDQWNNASRIAFYSGHKSAKDNFYVADLGLSSPKDMAVPVNSQGFLEPSRGEVLLLSRQEEGVRSPEYPYYFKNCKLKEELHNRTYKEEGAPYFLILRCQAHAR